MKRLFPLLCLLFSTAYLNAQISMQPSVPAVGMIQKDQLWNVLLINSTSKQYECRLQLVLRDRTTGEEILTATTGQFLLGGGAKQLNATLLNPIQYNYIISGIDNKLQSLIPAGTYMACYALSDVTLKESNLAEECIPFDAEPLSPPMLIFPSDSAQLENAPTQFSWTPPMPAGMFNKLYYDVVITAINDGQRPTEALQENLPFYSDGSLFNNVLNYPNSSISFEKDKWYAWQIVAKDDRNYAGKSEVWVFKIKGKTPDVTTTNDAYIFINSNIATTKIYQLPDKQLFIKYYAFDKQLDANIVIKNLKGDVMQTIKQPIVYGDNFLKINLSGSIAPGQFYHAEITDGNNKTYSILFSINK